MEPDVPEGVDPDVPSIARVYDYLLGGHHNFAVDRIEGKKLLAEAPGAVEGSAANRRFLGRAVRYLAEQGVRQFLDLGSGIPSMNNVHEVAHAVAPDARIVYVDRDAVAVRHSRFILRRNPRVRAVEADFTDPERLLARPEVDGFLDFDQPVAVLLLAVLHFVVDDDEVARILRTYRDATVPGSYLAFTHLSSQDPTYGPQVDAFVRNYSAAPMCVRTRDQVAALMDGYELVEPGVEWMGTWHAEPDALDIPAAKGGWGVVGRRI